MLHLDKWTYSNCFGLKGKVYCRDKEMVTRSCPDYVHQYLYEEAETLKIVPKIQSKILRMVSFALPDA